MNPKVETEMKQIRIIWLMALFLTSVIAWGQTTALTDNGDGTWTLASMPGYNVALEVEYEDDDSNPEVYTEFAEETGTLTL